MEFKSGLNSATGTSVATGCDSNYAEYAGQYGDGSKASNAGSVVGTYPCYADFYQGFGVPTYALSTLDTGYFIQDNWKFSPRLTFELGVRYDHESLPGPSTAFTTATTGFTPYQGLLNHPSDNEDFGPRIGFSYDLFGKGSTVLRGGYGLYYGRITNGNLLEVLLDTGSPQPRPAPPSITRLLAASRRARSTRIFTRMAAAAPSPIPTSSRPI